MIRKPRLEDAYNGLEKIIFASDRKAGEKCNGFGTQDDKEPLPCAACHGSGRVHRQHGFYDHGTVCPDASGRGRKLEGRLSGNAGGEGTVPHTKGTQNQNPGPGSTTVHVFACPAKAFQHRRRTER